MNKEDILKKYEGELQMSIDPSKFPHSFNILRRMIIQNEKTTKDNKPRRV